MELQQWKPIATAPEVGVILISRVENGKPKMVQMWDGNEVLLLPGSYFTHWSEMPEVVSRAAEIERGLGRALFGVERFNAVDPLYVGETPPIYLDLARNLVTNPDNRAAIMRLLSEVEG